MELTGKLEEAFNRQVTMEQEASITYRQLAVEMELADLPGIASWFRAQAEEELEHRDKFIDHMTDRGARPVFQAIPANELKIESVLDAFEASLAHEIKVSEAIRDIYRLSLEAGDIDSIPLLNWFVDEQVEEEATVGEIIGRVKRIGNDGSGILALDRELGSRGGDED
ncbi:MAG: ferritin [Galactobacter sp.]|uniref:ferritin n=1 Tax=Galactobacter sp. TaxID=2676125 RepID=UPI0025BAA02B|nr:ferritin [Galactobacter sp.]